MKDLSVSEVAMVSGGAGVSAETVGCAIGGAVGARAGGLAGGAAGCVAGSYIANNAGAWGAAFGRAVNSSGAFKVRYIII
ncbi:MAG: hypothetical protein ACN6OP_04575 [Pseudomonadales bacterium]|uniref:hypothetical protein n=1 Tax=Stenotrophomonas maltophilia TaxID=40324 RepID=UPI000A4EB8E5|nr:hypothetical protein [Stenotrophomonas maltophilia]